jgi:hypothetical protein
VPSFSDWWDGGDNDVTVKVGYEGTPEEIRQHVEAVPFKNEGKVPDFSNGKPPVSASELEEYLRSAPAAAVPKIPTPATTPLDGARERGGRVKAGGTYLVGEKGPEIVQFDSPGYVHDAKATKNLRKGAETGRSLVAGVQSSGRGLEQSRAALGASSQRFAPQPASGDVNITISEIVFHGIEDMGAAAAEVRGALEGELASLMRGSHLDRGVS